MFHSLASRVIKQVCVMQKPRRIHAYTVISVLTQQGPGSLAKKETKEWLTDINGERGRTLNGDLSPLGLTSVLEEIASS